MPDFAFVPPDDPEREALARILAGEAVNYEPQGTIARLKAQEVLASDWLEARDQKQREQGWDDALNAIAWCVENGSPNLTDAIEYVGRHNAHRVPEPDDSQPGGE